jgi:UDP-glucose 4-epimerase
MILITGGFGFIGTHVTRALLDAGESCVVASRRAGPLTHQRLVVERVDVADRAAFLDIGRRHHITGIVNLVGAFGFSGAPEPATDAALTIETLLNVLRAAHDWEVPRVGFASTIGVYIGATDKSPLREDVPLPMSTGHGIPAFKKIGELLGDHIAATTGVEIVNYRIAGAWGPGARPTSPFLAAPALIHAAVNGTTPDFSTLHSPVHAEDAGDLIYVKDCARAIALLHLTPTLNHQTYNVGGGHPTTNASIAAAVTSLIPGARTNLLPGRNPAGPTHDLYLDIQRLQQDTGYHRRYDTHQAVTDYVSWLRAGNDR